MWISVVYIQVSTITIKQNPVWGLWEIKGDVLHS